MSELINEKDVLVALGKGESVQYKCNEPNKSEWLDLRPSGWCLTDFLEEDFLGKYLFRLKPRTIYLNGIEVPAPFEPEEGEEYWYLTDCEHGYGEAKNRVGYRVGIAAWRTEEQIKQVVAALRIIFNPK